MKTIDSVRGRQIFDSRGTPTVEAEITLENGCTACASVPSGASTGRFEACELRDGGEAYGGKGVEKAAENINGAIQNVLKGQSFCCQQALDRRLLELDGTDNKSRLGANALLAVSLAFARVCACDAGMELFRYLGGQNAVTLPIPMMNVLNGGAHAGNNVDIQEFMIMPIGARSFREAMRMGTEVYKTLGAVLKGRGLATAVGDEGGYAPDLPGDETALALLVEAIEKAGFQPGKDLAIAIDAATSDWYHNGSYTFPKQRTVKTREEMIGFFEDLCARFPIVSIEDPLAEEDFEGFAMITSRLGNRVQIVGDDLFVTNTSRLKTGIAQGAANAILVKPNQIGSLAETMEAVRTAKENRYNTILSHRSGETEDTAIADIAVALNAGQIKTGAPARTDRVCKYNRLLKIEQLLGHTAIYPTCGSLIR